MFWKVTLTAASRRMFVAYGIEDFLEVFIATGVRLYAASCRFFYNGMRNIFAAVQDTVTLPLSVYQGEERFQNQELSFTMSAKANIQKAEDQTFAHDGFTIYVTNIVRTTNVVRFSVRYQLTEEEREKLDETNTGLTSVISGDEVEDGQNGFTSGYEVVDGYVEEHIHAGISPDLDQIALQTLLVENGGYVRDGKVIAEDMIRLNE